MCKGMCGEVAEALNSWHRTPAGIALCRSTVELEQAAIGAATALLQERTGAHSKVGVAVAMSVAGYGAQTAVAHAVRVASNKESARRTRAATQARAATRMRMCARGTPASCLLCTLCRQLPCVYGLCDRRPSAAGAVDAQRSAEPRGARGRSQGP